MGNLSFLTRAEIESLGPPTPEELEELEVSEAFLRDLALKHVAAIAEPTTANVAEKLHLPPVLDFEDARTRGAAKVGGGRARRGLPAAWQLCRTDQAGRPPGQPFREALAGGGAVARGRIRLD